MNVRTDTTREGWVGPLRGRGFSALAVLHAAAAASRESGGEVVDMGLYLVRRYICSLTPFPHVDCQNVYTHVTHPPTSLPD